MGYSLFAQQRIGESIKALAKSLELDVTNAEAHKILGRNLMIIGRFDAAQLEFEQALRYKPDSAESHYNLGKLFSIQDTWEPARKAFEAALRIDPGYVEAVTALGFALEALGDDEGAVASYEKAAALNAERKGAFAAPHVNLSAYYNRTGNPAAALEQARKAIALDPKSDRAWFQKGRADERGGDLEAAAECVQPGDRPQFTRVFILLRARGRLPSPRKNQGEPRGHGDVQRLEHETAELEKKRRAGSLRANVGGIRSDLARSGGRSRREPTADGRRRGFSRQTAVPPATPRQRRRHFHRCHRRGRLAAARNVSGERRRQTVPARGNGLRRRVLRL